MNFLPLNNSRILEIQRTNCSMQLFQHLMIIRLYKPQQWRWWNSKFILMWLLNLIQVFSMNSGKALLCFKLCVTLTLRNSFLFKSLSDINGRLMRLVGKFFTILVHFIHFTHIWAPFGYFIHHCVKNGCWELLDSIKKYFIWELEAKNIVGISHNWIRLGDAQPIRLITGQKRCILPTLMRGNLNSQPLLQSFLLCALLGWPFKCGMVILISYFLLVYFKWSP